MIKNDLFLRDHNKIAAIMADQNITYKDLINNVSTYIDNIYTGQRFTKIAIYSENRFEWIYAIYSAWAMGCTAVTIDHLSTPDELAYMLNDSKPELVFISNTSKANYDQARASLTYKPMIFNLDFKLPAQEVSAANSKLISDIGEDLKQRALIIYTSGTTGEPKGVMLSFENLLINIYSVTDYTGIYQKEDKVLLLLPLHHAFPLLGSMIIPIYRGSTIVFTPSLAPADVIKSITDNQVSILIAVPRFYEMIRKGIMEKVNKSAVAKLLMGISRKIDSQKVGRIIFGSVQRKFGGKLKHLVAGGAAMDSVVGMDMRHLGFEVLEGYGMTEAGPMITFTRPNEVLVGSPGPVIPGCEVKFENEEILARGPNIMMGYFNRPEETAAVLKDGWLYTGDKGYFNEQGMLFVTGRTKEIIVLSNGKNINPVEIEFKIMSMAKGLFQELAVFEYKDSLALYAYPSPDVLAKSSLTEIEEETKMRIIELYNSQVSSYKRITSVFISDKELPKTRLSKTKRFLLPELAEQLSQSTTPSYIAEPDSEEFKILKDYILDNKKRVIRANSHFEMDLGLDSLDKISLLVFVNNTFGTNLSEEVLADTKTIDKLIDYIQANKTKQEIETINWSDILKQKINVNLPKAWFTQILIKQVSRIFLSTYFRTKAKGLENLPKQGPFILAPNHQSFIDGLFVTSFMKSSTVRKTYFYAKQKHVKNFFMKFLANTNNVIVMDLNKDLKTSLQKMAAVLEKGKNLIIFPEGTRSKTGELGDFKKTFAILSRELNVPIVPVAIDGAFKALPSGKIFPKPFKKVSVEYLKPVYPESHTYESLNDAIREMIETKMEYAKA